MDGKTRVHAETTDYSGHWPVKGETGSQTSDSGMYSRSVVSERTPLLSNNDANERARWRSIRVMYMTMFIGSIGFSVILPSVWPFLRQVDYCVTTDFLGYVVAAYSVGQFVASPAFGALANCTGSRLPLMISLFITVVGNVMYAFSGAFHAHNSLNGIFMLVSRLLVGIGAGCVSVTRAYVALATKTEERTAVMANMSAAQSLGFIIGPALAAAFAPVGKIGTTIKSVDLTLNMYTLPALLAGLLAVINMVVVMVFFSEHRAHSSSSIQESEDEEPLFIKEKIDYKAAASCIALFFVILFIFAVFETILSPLTMDELDWSGPEAALYNGVMLLAAGAIAIVIFMVIKILAKMIDERYLFLGGLLICALAFLCYQPFGSEKPKLAPSSNHTNDTFDMESSFSDEWTSLEPAQLIVDPKSMSFVGISPLSSWSSMSMNNSYDKMHKKNCDRHDDTSKGGCPRTYDWCTQLPMIHLSQLIVGCFLVALGYPVCAVMAYTIYSKILGSGKQGTMMGILTAAGSAARVLGPIFVSNVYANYGPRISFAAISGIVFLSAIFLMIVFRRLVPYGQRK